MSEFIPEIVFSAVDRLAEACTVWLDGERNPRVAEARVSLASFDGPAFGEIIVFAGGPDDMPCSTASRMPRLGEFNYGNNGVWCKFACGQVFIELTEKGREELGLLKAALARGAGR